MQIHKITFTQCPHCNQLVAKTITNPDGICPAYACKSAETFYEQDNDTVKYDKRMKLTEKYRGLYFCSVADCTLHFLYGLANGKMLFIDDVNYALYVISECTLHDVADIFAVNNYYQFESSEK